MPLRLKFLCWRKGNVAEASKGKNTCREADAAERAQCRGCKKFLFPSCFSMMGTFPLAFPLVGAGAFQRQFRTTCSLRELYALWWSSATAPDLPLEFNIRCVQLRYDSSIYFPEACTCVVPTPTTAMAVPRVVCSPLNLEINICQCTRLQAFLFLSVVISMREVTTLTHKNAN